MSAYPYQDRFPVNRTLPEHGRPREEILAEMQALATEEDASWEGGRVSGTMYCGDHDHYNFMNDVFGLYAHVNILQRDICPSATRYEGEVLAMALDLFHGDAVTDGEPAGLVTSGGTGSICHAVLAYRERAQLHQARDRSPGLRQGLSPVRDRAAPGPGRPGHHAGRRRLGARQHRRPDHRIHGLGL